jgi:hypothetical protein
MTGNSKDNITYTFTCNPELYPRQFLSIFALDFISSSLDVVYFMITSTDFKEGFKKKLKMRNAGLFLDSLPEAQDIDREKLNKVRFNTES